MKAAEFRRVYGSEERVEFVKALPCCVCGSLPSENHHVRSDGVGRKANYKAIVPACWDCHRRYHTVGTLSMLQQLKGRGLMLRPPGRLRAQVFDQWDDVAAAVERLWQARC